MDSFDIDMELLRRIGEIRRAVEQLNGDDPQALAGFERTIKQARDRSGAGNPAMNRLLDALAWGVRAATPEERTATSRLATGILAAAAAAEQAVFTDGPAAAALLDQAGSTFFLALDRGPEDWACWTPPSGIEGASNPSAPLPLPQESRRDTPPGSMGGTLPTLDDLAALLIRMNPEDRGETLRLREMLAEVADSLPPEADIQELLAEMSSLLASVTVPQRTRKAVRQEAVERVGELLEEAILRHEEGERIPLEATTPREATSTSPWFSEAAEDEESLEALLEAEPVEAPLPAATKSGPSGATSPGAEDLPGKAFSGEDFPETDPLPGGMDPDLVRDFLAEGSEYLEQAEDALLSLEADPRDKEAVNVVFRAFHTIKGVSGFLDLRRISDLAHHAETLLSKVRDDELRYSGTVADLSLRGIDVLKALLRSVQDAMEDGFLRLPPTYGPLFNILANPELHRQIEEGRVTGIPGGGGPRPVQEEEEAEADAPADEGEGEGSKQTSVTGNSIRVRTDRLDRLVDMVGELVIAHSMLAQDQMILRDRGTLSRTVDHSAKILRELQDLSTSLRMVPLKPAFRKVTRTVRDLSKKIGKPVHLIAEGEDTEIDRTMVDVLADPLVHMVRNSLDHGLENPEERIAAGKPREGRIRISAYQAGGSVVIDVADDGRGLDREKILAKAKERGVVDSDRGLTDQEVYALIFAPGFSTADKVTEVSGRGVGMDVVRRNVESLRGRVSIDSRPGEGSTFSIHLPLTLAITDGMIIRVGSQRFIIPSVKIHMSLRPEASALSTVTGKGEMVLLQGALLPVIRLHRLWNIPDAVLDPTQGILVVVGEGGQRSALLVDDLVTQQQFVVKPLAGVVAKTQGVAGGAIMGNGDVGLILDPEGIIALARGLTHAAAA